MKILTKLNDLIDRTKYKWSGRHKYFLEIKEKIDKVETQKKADIVEVEIRRKLEEPGLLKYEEAHLQVALGLLDIKRGNL